MVTRESQRGRGAAGMLITWGAKQAEAEGVLAYLEASALGKPVYTKYGFKEVGEASHCDLRPHGADVVFVIAHMAKLPPGWNGNK
jgi:predicted GNAT family N-acyltransferase